MCIARVPVAVTATRIQNGARRLRARPASSASRDIRRLILIRCQLPLRFSRTGKDRDKGPGREIRVKAGVSADGENSFRGVASRNRSPRSALTRVSEEYALVMPPGGLLGRAMAGSSCSRIRAEVPSPWPCQTLSRSASLAMCRRALVVVDAGPDPRTALSPYRHKTDHKP